MDELIKHIDKYNFINYLIPGFVFAYFQSFDSQTFTIETNFINLILKCYFIGLVNSRIASLIIQPLLTKFKIIKFEEYHDFINASKIDDKINTSLLCYAFYFCLTYFSYLYV